MLSDRWLCVNLIRSAQLPLHIVSAGITTLTDLLGLFKMIHNAR